MPELSRFLGIVIAMYYRDHGPPHFHANRWSNRMRYRLIGAKHVSGYVLRLKFSDGLEGDVDLKDEIYGPMFEPLRDLEAFKRFRLDSELRTLVWPNGADFSPEFLHEKVRVAA